MLSISIADNTKFPWTLCLQYSEPKSCKGIFLALTNFYCCRERQKEEETKNISCCSHGGWEREDFLLYVNKYIISRH